MVASSHNVDSNHLRKKLNIYSLNPSKSPSTSATRVLKISLFCYYPYYLKSGLMPQLEFTTA